MDEKELMQFLIKKDLFDTVKNNAYYFKRIFKQCFNASENDSIVLVSDLGEDERNVAAMVAGAYCMAAKSLGIEISVLLQSSSSTNVTDEKVANGLLNLQKGGIAMMALTNKLGTLGGKEKSYRTLAKSKGHRFASSTSLGGLTNDKFADFVKAIDIDYFSLQRRMQLVKEKLDAGNEVNVTTPAGTDIRLKIKHQKAISVAGEYINNGNGGNIPVGEVYMPPDKKDVEGMIVIDGSMRDHQMTRIISSPIRMTVKDGAVTDIEGGEEAKLLEQSLQRAESMSKYSWGVRRIGEFGIGMNPGARIIGSTLIDEKTLGTCHFALGSNYWFGGTIKAIIHYDQVLKNPTIKVDDEVLKFTEQP